MKLRNLFKILIFTIMFSSMLSINIMATEKPIDYSVALDRVVEKVNDNTFIQPIKVNKDGSKTESDITINIQNAGLENVFANPEIIANKRISYGYNKESGDTNSDNGGIKASGWVVVEVLSYDKGDWNALIKEYSEVYESQLENVLVGNRKARYFKNSTYEDEYNGVIEGSNIPEYSKKSGYEETWLIYLPEFENSKKLIFVLVHKYYTSSSLAEGNSIDVYRNLHESYRNEYEQASKSIVDSIKIQIDLPGFGNSQREDLTEDDEYSENELELVILNIPGPDNTIQTVVGTVVPGVGIIIIAILGISTPPPPKPSKGPTGIRDGMERTLKGKTDGREYNIKYNAEKDEWTNTETDNPFYPEKFEGWQNDLAKDLEDSSKTCEKMSNRDTEFDREVKESVEKDKENAELLKKLHHLRRNLNLHRTEAGRINRPSGEPGSMTDKINDLEKQLINGEAVDKELLRKVRRVYTKASSGDISGYNDLPNNSIGKEIGETILLTEKEILSGSSKKALVLRGLLALASGGATEMGMEIASAGFVIKDYVDKGGDSVVEGMILGMGNAVISEGAGRITGGYAKVISKNVSKAFHRLGGTSKEGYKIFKGINNAKNAKIKINGKDTTIGLKDKMIDDIVENTAETVKNIYVAPPFQDIYKSYFI
ncbi:hypothetical protein [Clostridium vincentii]|uniref:Uncharacterized protein n=1 Tax=Clostridium vincentii TaxID=52704 RepID=A0A2T0BIS0_9CLOT|nr:hypothetical protein [Clostridium vincentii]PRR83692.1 hypothetical protein CLVI_06390 [Clostridium vincentii]